MPGEASKPKGKAGKRSVGERFHVLNNFIDFTLAELSRVEIAVRIRRVGAEENAEMEGIITVTGRRKEIKRWPVPHIQTGG